MDSDYKLIHAVDPTKIKVNIKEKFAKLTLSSNKKKCEAQESTNLRDLEACKRVSRNLMDDLQVADELTRKQECNYINPLLRSDSPSDCDSSQNKTLDEHSRPILNKSFEMEALHMSSFTQNIEQSQNNEEFDAVAERLSEQVSCLTLNSKPITLSSLSNSDEEDDDDKTAMQAAQEKQQQHHYSTNAQEISICISSSSSEEESQDAITISDSSQSEDYDLMTSNIPISGETADALLPSTFSNDKADRMEAFLRDVSQARREMMLGDGQPEEIDRRSITNFYCIAAADTESMPPDFFNDLDKQEKHNQLLDDTEPMTEAHASMFSSDNQGNTSLPTKDNNDKVDGRQLAEDDTIPNTAFDDSVQSVGDSPISRANVTSTSDKYQNNDSLDSNLPNNSVLPEESIVISETASEDEVQDVCQESPQTPVTKKSTTQSSTPDNLSEYSQISQKQHTMGSINISAKINIKIHISELVSSDSEESAEEYINAEVDESPPLPEVPQHASPSNENEAPATESDKSSTDIRSEKMATTPTTLPEAIDQEEAGFMEHAQKLLNQLYGKAWQTPEVIRTLHKSRFDKQTKKPTTARDITTNLELSTRGDAPVNQTAEESVLADFSIFRRNIKTNLDSTRRVVEPTPLKAGKNLKPRNVNSEKRAKTNCVGNHHNFKVPQTEVKKSQRGGTSNERWRQLVDDADDSEGVNASDDEAPDKTIDAGSSSDACSDKSWSKDHKEDISSTSSSSDNDSTFKKQKRNNTTRRRATKHHTKSRARTNQDKLVYMDLSKDEVEIIEGTPLANNDEHLKHSLQHILSSHKYEEKPRLEATPMSTKTRRKLFTANFGNESEDVVPAVQTDIDSPVGQTNGIVDKENVRINCQPMPAIFAPFNKQLEAVKTGTPIFKIQTPKSAVKTQTRAKEKDLQTTKVETPKNKYGFLKSLDVCVGKSLCHPEALYYRENYRLKKEDLGKTLYDLYNEKLFNNKLQVSLVWNKKLLNTAGRCLNKKRLGVRTSVVELSEKVLTSADRLRCTLIHELCHAATWIFNGEGGHGATWKSWANKANAIFPEIPKIGVCHQYDIEYKYTYKCTLCAAKSHAHSKSKKVENIRCSYCHGAIEIFLNKKDKEGNIIPTPVREPTGFAKFVKDNYKEYKQPNLKHTDVMKILSNEFALLKVTKAN